MRLWYDNKYTEKKGEVFAVFRSRKSTKENCFEADQSGKEDPGASLEKGNDAICVGGRDDHAQYAESDRKRERAAIGLHDRGAVGKAGCADGVFLFGKR